MAKTLSNFLVGIGFDLDNKSVDGVVSGIDGVKSKALQLGAVVAGAFGIKALTSDFAASRDELGKFAQVFGGTANDINAFGNAIRLEGGTLEGFMAQLASFEQFRAGLATGDIGFLEAAGKAGISVGGLIAAEDSLEGFLTLADQFQAMSQRQRIAAAQALGLDEASIRLLSKGRDEIERIVDVQREMRPITEEMTDLSAEYNDQMQNLSTNIGGVADQISTRLLPQINNVLAGLNEWISLNDKLIDSGIDTFFDAIEGHLAPITASLGLLGIGAAGVTAGGTVAAAGKATGIGALATAGGGIRAAGALAGRAGLVGAAGTAGYAVGSEIYENLDMTTRDLIGGVIAQALANLGSEDAQAAIDATMRYRASMMSQQPVRIQNQVIIDGQVIDDRVHKVTGEMADQAIQDLQSTEGG